MRKVLVIIGFLFLLTPPIQVDAAAYMGGSFCITTYDGFKNLKDEFVFARTGEASNYEYYKKPPGNLRLIVPLKVEKISFLITNVDESDVEAHTFRGNNLGDFSEKEQLAINSGKNNFSKVITIDSGDSRSKEFSTSCHKLSLDAKHGWLYPHNLLNNLPLLLALIIFPLLVIFASAFFLKKVHFSTK